MSPLSTDASGPVPARGRWGALVAAMIAALIVFAIWIVRSDEGPVPPFLGGPRPTPAITTHSADRILLDVAGSGSNLPITRALASAFPGPIHERPVVHDSIGSGGGVRALLDDAVDLALVSRPLAPTERELGLVEIPYARVPVMVAVHAAVPDEDIMPSDLLAIFDRERTTWSDGSPIVVLMREPGDSSHRAVAETLPGFSDANDRAWADDRFRVLYHDEDMREAIAATVGAIGLYGQGALPANLPIRALRIGGVAPTLAAVESGAYPYFKDLVFVSRGPPQGAAGRFVAFAHSDDGRRIIAELGALPRGEGQR